MFLSKYLLMKNAVNQCATDVEGRHRTGVFLLPIQTPSNLQLHPGFLQLLF